MTPPPPGPRCADCNCGWEEGEYDTYCECRCHTDPGYKPLRAPPSEASPPSPASSSEPRASDCAEAARLVDYALDAAWTAADDGRYSKDSPEAVSARSAILEAWTRLEGEREEAWKARDEVERAMESLASRLGAERDEARKCEEDAQSVADSRARQADEDHERALAAERRLVEVERDAEALRGALRPFVRSHSAACCLGPPDLVVTRDSCTCNANVKRAHDLLGTWGLTYAERARAIVAESPESRSMGEGEEMTEHEKWQRGEPHLCLTCGKTAPHSGSSAICPACTPGTMTMKRIDYLRSILERERDTFHSLRDQHLGVADAIERTEKAEKAVEAAIREWIAQDCQKDSVPLDPRETVEYWRARASEAETKLREVPCVVDAHGERDALPDRISDFVTMTFGEKNLTNRWERTMRVLEEAIEFAQAVGVTEPMVTILTQRVYSREPGDVLIEIGNLGVTLLAWCKGIGDENFDRLMMESHARVTLRGRESMREKHRAKVIAGIAIPLEGEDPP